MEAHIEGNLGERNKVLRQERFDRLEAAQYLGISTVTIDRALAKRKIGCYRIGRRVIFSRAHLDEFLSSNEHKAKSYKKYQ